MCDLADGISVTRTHTREERERGGEKCIVLLRIATLDDHWVGWTLALIYMCVGERKKKERQKEKTSERVIKEEKAQSIEATGADACLIIIECYVDIHVHGMHARECHWHCSFITVYQRLMEERGRERERVKQKGYKGQWWRASAECLLLKKTQKRWINEYSGCRGGSEGYAGYTGFSGCTGYSKHTGYNVSLGLWSIGRARVYPAI